LVTVRLKDERKLRPLQKFLMPKPLTLKQAKNQHFNQRYHYVKTCEDTTVGGGYSRPATVAVQIRAMAHHEDPDQEA
jgi:hypothetical protein